MAPLLLLALGASPPPGAAPVLAGVQAAQDVYATFETSLGSFTCRLFSAKAPEAVAAFVGWATGAKPWTDLRRTTTLSGRPLFDGTWIYRAVPGFGLQGGDPFNAGLLPPTDPWDDPATEGGTFDEAGALATVGTGPKPYGSEFLVTAAPAPWLNGRHTVFGRVVSGMEVVDAISRVPVGLFNRPVTPVVVRHVRISPEMPGSMTKPTSTHGDRASPPTAHAG